MVDRTRRRWDSPNKIRLSRVSRISRTCRSAYALQSGVCGGVLRICRASVFNTPSRAAKLVSRSWTRNRELDLQSSTTIEKLLACCAIRSEEHTSELQSLR